MKYLTYAVFIFLCSCAENRQPNEDAVNREANESLAGVQSLAESLTFHASFDETADASFGKGDLKIYSGNPEQENAEIVPGMGDPTLAIAAGRGRYGDALEYTKENSHVAFYKLANNIDYSGTNFEGTLSLWMSLDTEDIPNRYCDPIQLTDKYYASDAIWLDITKNDVPPDLRLGVLGDRNTWDVNDKEGAAEEFFWHLLKISEPPFEKGKWTHLAITWQLNTDGIGRAKLYIDGEYAGQSGPVREPFNWDMANVTMRLGTGMYVGLFDDLALFSKSLQAGEIAALYQLENGVGELYEGSKAD